MPKPKTSREELLKECQRSGGLEWWLMDKEERRLANEMVKQGVLHKGRADTKQGQVTFFAN